MTDFTDPAVANLRLSNAERDEAVASLETHAKDGRLSESELTTRVAAARTAVTRGDLAPLFSDLPENDRPENDLPAGGAAPRVAPPETSQQRSVRRRRPAFVLVNLTPFIALVLFFLTGWIWGYQYSWLWFLLVPVGWIAFNGFDSSSRDKDSDHDRS